MSKLTLRQDENDECQWHVNGVATHVIRDANKLSYFLILLKHLLLQKIVHIILSPILEILAHKTDASCLWQNK